MPGAVIVMEQVDGGRPLGPEMRVRRLTVAPTGVPVGTRESGRGGTQSGNPRYPGDFNEGEGSREWSAGAMRRMGA